MEDETGVNCGPGFALFGVYDGHAGGDASRFLREQLHRHVIASKHFESGEDGATRQALGEAFESVETSLLEQQREHFVQSGAASGSAPGSTAAVLLLRSGGRCLHVGWVGDSKVVLCRDGKAVALTVDHALESETERQRVLAEGGTIEHGRLRGYLSVSRALGGIDAATQCKPTGLSARAELRSEPLGTDDEFALIASDGLWDVMSIDEAVAIARSELRAYQDPQMAAEKLLSVALSRPCDDNVSVIVVRLFPPPGTEAPEQERTCRFVRMPTSPNFVQLVGGFEMR